MKELLDVFKALSDETRLRIIKLLEDGELCVCDIVAALNMVQPKASFHLRILKEAGLIDSRKEGRWIYYRIDDTDIFCRFLTLSILDRVSEDSIGKDKRRLLKFRKTRNRCCMVDNKSAQPRILIHEMK